MLEQALVQVNQNQELKTLWEITNVNAITRLGMTDHGIVHFQIVANIAVRLARILKQAGVEFSIVRDFGMNYKHAELVLLFASLYHDLGMTIERNGHEGFSLILANSILRESLDFLKPREKTIVISETLHAIISHRSGGKPLTLEAGIVRVADALDMSEGRSRIPYSQGKTDIHSISAAAIDNVEISKGDKKPINLTIHLNNAAGIFQIDELLSNKIKGSGLEQYLEVGVRVNKAGDKSLVKDYVI